ncbi:MAG TPA: hypothetical protein VK186_10540 [Candidatus Deferrimicrobium sp.]|nr:hypothetical protein [Candidatus Deferrimicrobium sp.]
MYLAPLNYDRFFKKVFSEPKIAKAFLEDFLDIKIEEIERLENKHHLTDDATYVEFDYRCKINGCYVIIDMQQWYKRDIGKRFYLYHAVNTGLQLEKLPEKRLIVDTPCKFKVKDYSALEPVITLIWMAADTFGFKENYVAYSMAPEAVVDFIRNEELWRNPDIVEIMKERARTLNIMDNNKKDLDFLSKNRLIFAIQSNIVSNKSHARYERWFTFADKSRQEDNKEEDFEEYKNDEIFAEIIRRLEKRDLNPEEVKYIEEERNFWLEIIQLEQGIYKEGIEEGIEIGIEKGIEKGRLEGEKSNAINIARNMLSMGLPIDTIVACTKLSAEEIQTIN